MILLILSYLLLLLLLLLLSWLVVSDIPNRKVEGSKVWAPLMGYRKMELSVVGDGCEFGDKGTLKLCAIGKNVKVGARSKINNCVIMDAAIIGER